MESTNDREGFACPRDHHARYLSGFACLPHCKYLTPIVIGLTSRKVGGNLGDINLIQGTFHSQLADHLDTSAVDTLAPDLSEQQGSLDQFLKAWVDTGLTATTIADAYAGHALIVNIQNNAASSANYSVWTNKLTILEQFNWWMFNTLPTGVVANDQAWRMSA
jgi:hypothetical protein